MQYSTAAVKVSQWKTAQSRRHVEDSSDSFQDHGDPHKIIRSTHESPKKETRTCPNRHP